MDSSSRPQPAPRTLSEALLTTLKLIWSESDAFTRRRFAWSLALLILGAPLSATRPVIYKLTIDALGGSIVLPAYARPALNADRTRC